MTRPARPASGLTLAQEARKVGFQVVDRGMGWLEARSLPSVAGDTRPVVPDRTPVLGHAHDLAGVLNRLILSAIVLWVPAVCAYWVSSTLAALPMLVWYVAVAPILMRDIWRSRTTPEG
jgi:hypothetical protein